MFTVLGKQKCVSLTDALTLVPPGISPASSLMVLFLTFQGTSSFSETAVLVYTPTNSAYVFATSLPTSHSSHFADADFTPPPPLSQDPLPDEGRLVAHTWSLLRGFQVFTTDVIFTGLEGGANWLGVGAASHV